MKNKKINKEDLWCEYSDLPSPMAYMDCMDYDSMGNHGRYPIKKENNKQTMKKLFQKVIFWVTLKFPKKKRKSIWKL